MTDIAIYVDAKLMPPVLDILKALISDFPEVTGMELYDDTTDRTMPVLVLGNMPKRTPAFHVKTLSQKQILSNPAAMTELEVALRNLLKPPTFPPMEYEVVKYLTPEQEAALGNVLVVDIETGGNFDKALRPSEKYLLCVGINDGKHIYVFDRDGCNYGTRGGDQLVRILTKPGRKLVAHNMKFDFPTLDEQLCISMHGRGPLYGHFDTLLMHHSINHGAKEHDLKNLCHKYLGAPDWESGVKEYVKKTKDYSSIPPDLLHLYNAGDVYWTWWLLKYLEKIALSEPDRLPKVALHEFKMSRLFQDVEKNGVGVDVPYLTELREEFNRREEPILARLREAVGDFYVKGKLAEFNPGSWQQVKAHFKKAYDINLASTDEKHLMVARAKEEEGSEVVKFIDDLLEYREIGKMRGTYVDGILKRRRDNIVYPTFWVHGTSTGRLSSKDPNIQNIPRDKAIRRLVVPRAAGRTMIQADYSQAELRVMACLSGDPYLQSLFQPDSPDFFDNLMPIAFPNIDLPALSPGQRKQLRAKLKGVIYGMSYGRQAKAIAISLTEEDRKNPTTVQEAQMIMDNYFQQAPKLYAWRKEVSEIALDPTRTLVSPFGRQYQAEVVTSRNRQNVVNSALAFLPQSTASDLCVVAAERVQDELKSGRFGDTLIVATIHDAILLDTPDEYIETVKPMVTHHMRQSGRDMFGDLVLFDADTKAGPSWAECG
jgi:DNA polymerase-1